MSYILKVTGFKTKAQAEAFRDWYEGAGEQDASLWFEERKHDGDIDIDFMPSKVPLPGWEDDVLELPLDIPD